MIWVATYEVRYDEEVARQVDETRNGIQDGLAKGWLREITSEEAAKLRQYEP